LPVTLVYNSAFLPHYAQPQITSSNPTRTEIQSGIRRFYSLIGEHANQKGVCTMLSRLFLIITLTLLASTDQGKGIELSITEPMGVARAGWPVTSGVPLAPGCTPSRLAWRGPTRFEGMRLQVRRTRTSWQTSIGLLKNRYWPSAVQNAFAARGSSATVRQQTRTSTLATTVGWTKCSTGSWRTRKVPGKTAC